MFHYVKKIILVWYKINSKSATLNWTYFILKIDCIPYSKYLVFCTNLNAEIQDEENLNNILKVIGKGLYQTIR